jgi:hypothetical protein
LPTVVTDRALAGAFGRPARIPTTFVFGPDGERVALYVNDPSGPFVRPGLERLRADVALAGRR